MKQTTSYQHNQSTVVQHKHSSKKLHIFIWEECVCVCNIDTYNNSRRINTQVLKMVIIGWVERNLGIFRYFLVDFFFLADLEIFNIFVIGIYGFF